MSAQCRTRSRTRPKLTLHMTKPQSLQYVRAVSFLWVHNLFWDTAVYSQRWSKVWLVIYMYINAHSAILNDVLKHIPTFQNKGNVFGSFLLLLGPKILPSGSLTVAYTNDLQSNLCNTRQLMYNFRGKWVWLPNVLSMQCFIFGYLTAYNIILMVPNAMLLNSRAAVAAGI